MKKKTEEIRGIQSGLERIKLTYAESRPAHLNSLTFLYLFIDLELISVDRVSL